MKKIEVAGLFALAGIEVLKLEQIPNQYWGNGAAFQDIAAKSPWWEVTTKAGVMLIGWRKRVISIDWEATPVRKEITSDDVTKGEYMVHAWSLDKALEYLTELSSQMKLTPV